MDSRTAEISNAIDHGARLPHQATAIAMKLFLLLLERGEDQPIVCGLVARFVEALTVWGMSDVLSTQSLYARQLAESPGPLEYEEMHKLFSLCDEIHAMRTLGLSVEDHATRTLEFALRARFAREPKKAGLVAEDKVETWNRDYWWYAENLKG